MFTILIQEKGGEQRRMVFNKPEVTIGRVQGNDIVLPKGNVSKRHARIVLKDGKFIIVDLKSTNGTYVNGRKITSPLVVKDSDKIYIGDFIVGVDEAASGVEGDGPSESTTSPPGGNLAPSPPVDIRPPRPTEAQPMAAMPIPMSNMGNAEPMFPAPSQPSGLGPPSAPPRSVPPRPAPGPMREPMAARDPGPLPSSPDPVVGGPPARMPPISSPPPRTARPGGTMPPPLGSSNAPAFPSPPAPAAFTPQPPPMDAPAPYTPPAPAPSFPAPAPSFASPAPAPSFPAPAPSAPPPAPMPTRSIGSDGGQPAPVLPIRDPGGNGAAPRRALIGQGAKQRVGRAVSIPSRRGVVIEPLDPKIVRMLDLQSNILERLRAKLDLDKIPMERLHEEDLWQRAERATIDLVETLDTSGELPKYIDQDTLIKETLSEALALGPLEDLLADEKIDEIIIDRRDRVVVGKDGQLRSSGKAFSSDEVFERVVKRLVAEAGAKIDDATPIVDLRMRDGTRLTAAVAPVAARGACLVLKKPASPMPLLSDLGSQGAMSPGMADFLATCVTARRNILVCGGPGSGKTTVVAALAAASPKGERVVSIEEIAELSIARDEWIQLETRAGVGKMVSVDLSSLLETALRLVPDRLVVGEVRGDEALPLVHSLNASVDGAIVAMTGEGANPALSRLATLARAAGAHEGAIRELVAQAFEIVVHVARTSDGSVKVLSIEEVLGYNEMEYDTRVLFEQRGAAFSPTGHVPKFYSELEARGIPADQAVFR
ncbi:MAG: ATPase, T2SS/T4P/T4SS family [Kofleriaceae bacterium]